MIVFPVEQLLIMTPPHTASKSLHLACGEQAEAIWQVGPTPDGENYDHHTVAIANHQCDWNRVVVVRNPFDRAIGLWHHLVEWNARHGDGCISFDEFATWISRGCQLSWMYTTTICDWLGDVQFDSVLRFEQLEEDLNKLLGRDPPVVLPKDKITQRGERYVYYTKKETKDAIIQWASNDFDRFGYDSVE
jgi:hypothetical protein